MTNLPFTNMAILTPAQDPQKARSTATPEPEPSNGFLQPAALRCLIATAMVTGPSIKAGVARTESLPLTEETKASGGCVVPEIIKLTARAGPRPRRSVPESVSEPLRADLPEVAMRAFQKAGSPNPPLTSPSSSPGPNLLKTVALSTGCKVPFSLSGALSGVLTACTSQRAIPHLLLHAHKRKSNPPVTRH